MGGADGKQPLKMLEALAQMQQTHFPRLSGRFPSQRSHPFFYLREDDSAYFTATLLHSLFRLKPFFNAEESHLLEQIRLTACQGVAPFQNKQGLPRYNFWQTNPGRHFPNGLFFGKYDRYRPPDDVDDSVMVYMMQNRDQQEARWLMEHIDAYANGSRKWVLNCDLHYKDLRAYCTFFCKDMPLGFDACVISNVLYFNMLYGFETNFKQQDSIQYLLTMLERRDHLLMPESVSPYYPHASIILYHLAKLMSQFSIPELDRKRARVVQDIRNILAENLFPAERTMLESAWMWMTGEVPRENGGKARKGRFYFFVLPLTLELEGSLAQWLARQRWTHIRFHSEALEWAFQIENKVLRRSILKG
jgi:hypothetical protein